MAGENIITVIADQDDSLMCETVLKQEGFNIIKLDNCQNLLKIVAEEKPDLIIIDQLELEQGGGYKVLKEFKKYQISVPTIIKCHSLFNITSDLRKLIQVGIYNYLPFASPPSTLVESVKDALMTSKSVAFSLVIVDHLLSRIEALQKCNKTFKERFEWYEKNRQKLICDCNDLLINGVPYNKPKTTSLHNYGRASNGYYLGYKFVCGVCNTNWFCAESNTESEFLYSWEPADEKVILVKTENKFQPDPSEDFEPF